MFIMGTIVRQTDFIPSSEAIDPIFNLQHHCQNESYVIDKVLKRKQIQMIEFVCDYTKLKKYGIHTY
jgi:hypothetical protein